MYKIYFKQAWALLRQERLFSSVYIVGTGLAITLVMVLSIVFYVKTAPLYPEMNRDRMLVIRYGAVEYGNGGYSSSRLSSRLIREQVMPNEELEAVAITRDQETTFVQPEGSPVQEPTVRMAVNEDFWRVFSFRFVEGKPFTAVDVSSGLPVVVIARSLARRVFGEEEAVGRGPRAERELRGVPCGGRGGRRLVPARPRLCADLVSLYLQQGLGDG